MRNLFDHKTKIINTQIDGWWSNILICNFVILFVLFVKIKYWTHCRNNYHYYNNSFFISNEVYTKPAVLCIVELDKNGTKTLDY